MELVQAMRTAGSVRNFRADPVPLSMIYHVLDNARFAPSGANRQGWRVVVVTDPDVRAALGDLFRAGWYGWHAPVFAGDGPVERWDYADHIEHIPVHLVVLVAEASITTTIEALDTSRVVGGSSVYPFVQNILLGVREQGLGTTLTTVLVPVEAKVKELLSIPSGYFVAAHMTVGWPASPQPTRLSRRPVEQFATVDSFGGAPLRSDVCDRSERR
jgi:nitroreductase